MAGFDKSLLQVAANQPALNWSNNTTASSVTNVRVVVFVSYFFSSIAPSGLTIGGQTATRDLRVSSTADRVDVYSYPFTNGLASGSAIVLRASGGSTFNGGVLIGAVALTNVDMTVGGGVAGTGSTTTLPNPATNWGSGTASSAGGIGFGGAGNECATTSETATATTGVLVHHTWESGSQQGFATAYNIGGTNVAGTWASTSTSTTGGIVTYVDATPIVSTASISPVSYGNFYYQQR